MVIFSHVKISCFFAKVHLVFFWCVYKKKNRKLSPLSPPPPPPPIYRPIFRRGSRINTDWFPKRAPKVQASMGVRGYAPPGNFWNSTKSPFLGFWVFSHNNDLFDSPQMKPCKSVDYFMIIKVNFHDVLERFYVGKFILLIIYLLWNVTDFHKTVEASVDLCLILVPVMPQSIPSVPNGWDIQKLHVGADLP